VDVAGFDRGEERRDHDDGRGWAQVQFEVSDWVASIWAGRPVALSPRAGRTSPLSRDPEEAL